MDRAPKIICDMGQAPILASSMGAIIHDYCTIQIGTPLCLQVSNLPVGSKKDCVERNIPCVENGCVHPNKCLKFGMGWPSSQNRGQREQGTILCQNRGAILLSIAKGTVHVCRLKLLPGVVAVATKVVSRLAAAGVVAIAIIVSFVVTIGSSCSWPLSRRRLWPLTQRLSDAADHTCTM